MRSLHDFHGGYSGFFGGLSVDVWGWRFGWRRIKA